MLEPVQRIGGARRSGRPWRERCIALYLSTGRPGLPILLLIGLLVPGALRPFAASASPVRAPTLSIAGTVVPAFRRHSPQTTKPPGAREPAVTGVAEWATNVGYFNLHGAPRANAPVVGALYPGDAVTVTAALIGESVGGYARWYRLQSPAHPAPVYVLASAVGYLDIHGPWTGVADSNAEDGVAAAVSLSAPDSSAPSDGRFALGTPITVLGQTTGVALDPGNPVWYRVATGSYRAAYIYSAYLKYVRRGTAPPPRPVLTAASMLAIDLDTARVLVTLHADAKRSPASLVKMMTAAIALDRLTPTTVITVPSGAPSVAGDVGGTAMGLIPGQRLSLHDLLYGMLLPSGNDAAYTLASTVAGGQTAFAGLMNAKALHIGMLHTHFVQGYGLDAGGQYSTARDLATLARYDLAHYTLFRTIVHTAHHIIGVGPFHAGFDLHNTNKLLGVYPGTFGVKTGTTPNAGQNLIAAVSRAGHRVLVVVLGASDRYADATALLDYSVALDTRSVPG